MRIKHSRIPNIGRKTLWGLSGLEILDLSHNALSTVIEPNFDTLYSLRELYLNDNTIKSIVSAAFRHATKLQILSLANNMLEGEYLLLLMQRRPLRDILVFCTEGPRLTRFLLTRISLQRGFGLGARKFASIL